MIDALRHLNLGLAVLGSTSLLVCALMYRWTRDRWPWGRISAAAAGLTLLTVAGWAGVEGLRWLGHEGRDWLIHRPQRLTSYVGISLGDSKQVVEYKKGVPESVTDDPVPPTSGYNIFDHIYTVAPAIGAAGGMPEGRTEVDYNSWFYSFAQNQDYDSKSLTIGFDKHSGRVDEIECMASGPYAGFCDLPFGVGVGTGEVELRHRLGHPDSETFDYVNKRLFFKKFNLRFNLQRERVQSVYVTELTTDTHALRVD
jgi:hypothetical protein